MKRRATALATLWVALAAGACGDSSGGDDVLSEAPASCAPIERRIWKLTPEQYEKSLEALFQEADGVAARLEGSVNFEGRRYRNEAAHNDSSTPHVEQLFTIAEELAAEALAAPESLHPCLGSASADSCREEFVRDFGRQAFRRPLEEEEVTRYLGFLETVGAEETPEVALERFVVGILLSPHFLFRTELGPPEADGQAGPVRMTAHEIASAIAYYLTGSPPDEALLSAAADGSLDTEAGVEAQVRRLLDSPTDARGLRQFFRELFHTDEVASVGKDPVMFPAFDDALVAAMQEETDRYVEEVLYHDDGSLMTLLTADYTMANEAIASLYGIEGVEGNEFVRVSVPAPRAGILTQPSFLTVRARSNRTDIVLRGRFIREELLCKGVPPPPADVNAVLPETGDTPMTQREVLEKVHMQEGCAGCHRLMDPLGYSFESFDAVGAIRTEDKGLPLDTTGTVVDTGNDFSFTDARSFVTQLASLPEVPGCFARQVYHYAYGKDAGAESACVLDPASEAFDVSGENAIRELVVKLMTHAAFVNRR